MTNHRASRFLLPLALTSALFLAPTVRSQVDAHPNNSGATGGVNQGGSPAIHQAAGLDPNPQHGNSDSAAAQIDQMRQAERTRRVAADTAKLVQLSAELKAEIDAAHNQLSVDALKKASEIEKT